MDTVQIFDTTLRDGEQSPGFSMNREEKLRLARQLEQLGVDVIEAGFPIASPGDLEAVRAVAGEIRGCRVAALARARQEDVDAALHALEPAAKPRLHIFYATSDLHLKHKLRTTRHEAQAQIARMVRFGRKHCDEVEFSAEDASRSDIAYLSDVAEAAADAGATILNLPDTVGYTTPGEYAEMFRRVRARLASYPNIIFSAHRWNAPSTESASAPAMPRSKKSLSRCMSARLTTAPPRTLCSRKSIPPAACSPPSPAFLSRLTKQWSARMRLHTKRAFTRMAS